MKPKEGSPSKKPSRKANQTANQHDDIGKGEEPKREETGKLVLVYYKPPETKSSGVAFALVHETSSVEDVRNACRATREGGEAICIYNDIGKDLKIKDIHFRTSFNIIKIKARNFEMEVAIAKKKKPSLKKPKAPSVGEAK